MFGFFKKWRSRFRKDDGNFFLEISEIIGHSPKNVDEYRLALRHSSASKTQNKGRRLNNQRLEYLGDALLGAITADFLYHNYPGKGEGFLTSMRSKIVSRKHLNQIGLQLGLNKLLVKRTSRTAHAKSIYGDALEAFVGAIYVDLGYEKCCHFVKEKILSELLDMEALEKRIASHKGHLLEWAQKNKREVQFEITDTTGESHARRYEITLLVDGEATATGQGTSKKKAEEEAARMAYKKLLKYGQSTEKANP